MQASNAPSKSAVPFADSGTKNTIPVASQIGVTPGAASFTDGFPPLTMTPLAAGGVPPYGADFNGILNFLSAAVRWSQAGGRYPFDAAFATAVGGYPKGAVLAATSGNGSWLNLVDNNTADPDAGGAGWITTMSAGVVGSASNVRCSVTAASASATFTADEIVVGTSLGGPSYRLANFNKTLNISTTGAGGMDTGAPPTTGWVAIYAIYNPTTGASSILARNATAAAQPTVYGGANIPAGYTASALISVWPVVSSVLAVAFQMDRTVNYYNLIYSGAGPGAFTSVSVANAVPRNAKTINVNIAMNSTTAGILSGAICPTAAGLGTPGYSNVALYTPGGATSVSAHFHDAPLMTAQTIYLATGGPSSTYNFNSYGYTF